MVYFHHPDEFCPVSESAYCGAGSVHTMLLHTTADGVLQLFPGLPSEVSNGSMLPSSLTMDNSRQVRLLVEYRPAPFGLGSVTCCLCTVSITTVCLQWPDARFHQLRASRGLTVSAVRRNGSTDWVHLTAPTTGGEGFEGASHSEYTFAVPDDSRWMAATPHALPTGTVVVPGRRAGEWVVSIAENESVALWPAGTQAQPKLVMAPLPGNESEFNYWGYNHNMQPLH